MNDADVGVRAMAAGQLARLVPPVPGQPALAQAVLPAEVAKAPEAVPPAVQQAVAALRSAADEIERQRAPVDKLLGELAQATAARARDDAAVEHVRELRNSLQEQSARIAAALERVERADATARAAGGTSPAAATTGLIGQAGDLDCRAHEQGASLRERADDGAHHAGEFVSEWTGDAQLDIDSARAKTDVGDFGGAQRLLDRAAHQLRRAHGKSAVLDYAYAQLFERMADDAASADARRQLLERALQSYQQVSRSGGRLRDVANARVAKLSEQIPGPTRP